MKFNHLLPHLGSLAENVLGGVLTTLVVWWAASLRRRYWRRRFREVFGTDAFVPGQFHMTYAELSLDPAIEASLRAAGVFHPYGKSTSPGAVFSISHPISVSEVRAASYVSATIGRESAVTPRLSSDTQLLGELDVSFVAFGGPLSNAKTRDTFLDPAVSGYGVTVGDSFLPPSVRSEMSGPGGDIGLVMKIRPEAFGDRVWITCAGQGEWGTSGAAWYLATHWRRLQRDYGDEGFAVVVQVRPGQDQSATAIFQAPTKGMIVERWVAEQPCFRRPLLRALVRVGWRPAAEALPGLPKLARVPRHH